MKTHTCPGCRMKTVPDSILACFPCWERLSLAAQKAIRRTARLPILAEDRRAALAMAREEWKSF